MNFREAASHGPGAAKRRSAVACHLGKPHGILPAVAMFHAAIGSGLQFSRAPFCSLRTCFAKTPIRVKSEDEEPECFSSFWVVCERRLSETAASVKGFVVHYTSGRYNHGGLAAVC